MGALKITGQSAEPTVTSSDAGTMYYDTDTNKLRHYNGTAWADVSPAAAAITSEDLPAGAVIQVAKDHMTDTDSHAATGYGVMQSCPITPLSTDSHFLVMATGQVSAYNFGVAVAVAGIAAADTITPVSPIADTGLGSVTETTSGGHHDAGRLSKYIGEPYTIIFYHDPSLSNKNTIYYNLVLKCNTASTAYFNYTYQDANDLDRNAYVHRTISTITIFEIGQ